MNRGFHRGLGRQIVLEDLAEIITSSKDSNLRDNVFRYLSKLNRPCPSPNCEHMVDEGAFICLGYGTQQQIMHVEGKVTKIREIDANPLVIPVFCSVFSQLGEGKETCKSCRDRDFGYRMKLNGLYCHGCGFFLDYDQRRVGYSKEWTTISRNVTKLGISCRHCGKQVVSAKFGDYWFCDAECMREWCISVAPTAQ
ncbi:MAG: hypothetical protein IH932_01055 [Thaumarchaeota archaeon]|nr:hypothetical protein [Nitrososphaerota archaeon]